MIDGEKKAARER